MSSREVKTFEALPQEIRHVWNSPDNSGMESIVYAYNAGVRAGQSAGGDVRTIVATLYSVARIHHGIPDPFSGAVKDADAMIQAIAALAKEKP